jgi:hypothetical protein
MNSFSAIVIGVISLLIVFVVIFGFIKASFGVMKRGKRYHSDSRASGGLAGIGVLGIGFSGSDGGSSCDSGGSGDC